MYSQNFANNLAHIREGLEIVNRKVREWKKSKHFVQF